MASGKSNEMILFCASAVTPKTGTDALSVQWVRFDVPGKSLFENEVKNDNVDRIQGSDNNDYYVLIVIREFVIRIVVNRP